MAERLQIARLVFDARFLNGSWTDEVRNGEIEESPRIG